MGTKEDAASRPPTPQEIRAKLLEDIRALVTSATMEVAPDNCTPEEFRFDMRLSLVGGASLTIGLGMSKQKALEFEAALVLWSQKSAEAIEADQPPPPPAPPLEGGGS